MKTDYSEKEFEMVKQISPLWANLIESNRDSSIMPPQVLRILAEECFVFEKTGKAVDSLRRCLIANSNCNPYRKTPEYDNLIQL